jgi:BlaI family transcriptional regulator, penicillinase repressor
MKDPQVQLTDAEWAIIKEVWRHEPVAAPTVQEALEKSRGWSYSTVRTVMDRMVGKGLLTSEKLRNLTLFRSVLKQPEAQKGELLTTLRTAFNGALTPLVQCLLETRDLSAKELSELEKLIKAKKRKQE